MRSPWSMRAGDLRPPPRAWRGRRRRGPRPAASAGRWRRRRRSRLGQRRGRARRASRSSVASLASLPRIGRCDRAGQRAAVDARSVLAASKSKPRRSCTMRGEIGEAARHQGAVAAVLLHGGDQGRARPACSGCARPPRRAWPPAGPSAARRARSSAPAKSISPFMARAVMPAMLLAQAQEVGQLVQHLVLDDGRFHVGHQQPLAPARGGQRPRRRCRAGSRRRSRRRRRSNGRSQAMPGASQSTAPTVAPRACSASMRALRRRRRRATGWAGLAMRTRTLFTVRL